MIGDVVIWQTANTGTATGLGDWRYLTMGEKQLTSKEGLAIADVDTVRVYNRGFRILGIPGGELSSEVMAPNGHIYVGQFSRLGWSEDFAPMGTAIAAQLGDQGILIHELTHVWQHRNQGCVMVCMIASAGIARLQSEDPYDYWSTLSAQQSLPAPQRKPFSEYNIEQQAEMVSDRFQLANGGTPDQTNNQNATFGALNGVILFRRNP